MSRAPRLYAPLGDTVALRQQVELLVDVFHVEVFLHAPTDRGLEVLFDLVLDDERDLAEPRAVRVVQRKVNDKVPFPVYRRHLLEPAEAAAHARGKDDKSRLSHNEYLCVICNLKIQKHYSISVRICTY